MINSSRGNKTITQQNKHSQKYTMYYLCLPRALTLQSTLFSHE